MADNVKKCFCCDDEIKEGDYFYAYTIIVQTKTKTHIIGVQKCLHDLAEDLMSKRCHLSASEILLLRPDIAHEFLTRRMAGEEMICWFLEKTIVCKDCYTEWEKIVPLL